MQLEKVQEIFKDCKKVVCVNSTGYEYTLQEGEQYNLISIEEGIFDTPYITVENRNSEQIHSYYFRFEPIKEDQDNA